MQVQVNRDRSIEGDEAVVALLEAIVRGDLDRVGERNTRVEVHPRDENSDEKGGVDDLRCKIEARVAGFRPVAVTHDAATMEEAVSGAAGEMKRSLESTLARLPES